MGEHANISAKLIIEVYQRKPSIAEIVNWLKGHLEKVLGGYEFCLTSPLKC